MTCSVCASSSSCDICSLVVGWKVLYHPPFLNQSRLDPHDDCMGQPSRWAACKWCTTVASSPLESTARAGAPVREYTAIPRVLPFLASSRKGGNVNPTYRPIPPQRPRSPKLKTPMLRPVVDRIMAEAVGASCHVLPETKAALLMLLRISSQKLFQSPGSDFPLGRNN